MRTPATLQIVYGREVDTGRAVEHPLAGHAGKMMQVRGETGGGKSLLIAKIVLQYLELGAMFRQAAECPIVVIDLGGDLFLINLLMERCHQLGRTFRWFSLDPDDATFHFEPLQSCQSLRGSPGRKANYVTAGMNLAYQEGFGTGYFGRLNLATIREAFSRLAAKGLESPSLVELGEELTLMARRQRGSKEAAEALYAVDQLLDYDALRPVGDPERTIDVDRALEECHIVYFFLSTLQEPLAARATGTLAAWSVINAAAYRQKTGKPRRTVSLVIDEAAQVIHGQSFQDALVLSRKLGVRITAIYQSEAQLRSARGSDMSQVLRDNCAIKAFFTTDVGDRKELDSLLGHSKLETVPRQGLSITGLRTTTSQSEQQEPILKVNTVHDVNGAFGEFFLCFKNGQGHSEPVRVMSDFPTTKTEHDDLSTRPLPRREAAVDSNENRPISTQAPEAGSSSAPRRTSANSDPNRSARRKQLKDLYQRLREEQSWRLRDDASQSEDA